MTDLTTLLERAAERPADVDVAADLRRGHRALRRRRRVLAAGSAALVLGAGAGVATYPRLQHPRVVQADQGNGVAAGGFVLPSIPDGWELQAVDSSRALMAPDGTPKQRFDDPHASIQVDGNLLIYLRRVHPTRNSRTLEYDGRTFYVLPDTPYPPHGYPKGSPPQQLAVQIPSRGWLWLLEAPRLGWTLQQMVQYLDGVEVTSSAEIAPE